MQQISNRRFMYSPQTKELILGYQFSGRALKSSHAEEHFDSGTKTLFDSFIRGWIGTGREYPHGIVHFAPNIGSDNVELFDRAFFTVAMFHDNGADKSTVIRGFGAAWEQPLSNLIAEKERSKSMSEYETRPLELTATDQAGKVKEITEQLERGVKELFESERYQEYLTAMSKFHDYSINNTLLIVMQRPDASLVAGYSQWKKDFERNVKRGEKGIKILAPAPYKIKKETEMIDPDTQRPVIGADGKPVTEEKEITIAAFKPVTVFDVSQTEGKEIPNIGVDALTGSVEQYEDFWRALKEVSPVPVALEKIDGSAHGYYHLEDKRIAIDEGMSELQTIKTLIHEIAHAKLHDIDLNAPKQEQNRVDRRTREVEAESVAFTVCQHFGLETSDYSFGYIAGWSSDKDIKELKASLETIRTAASELITEIDERFSELQQQREAAQEQPPVFESLDPQRQQEIRSEVKSTLQMLVDADMKTQGEISKDTLDVLAAQGYELNEGIVQQIQQIPPERSFSIYQLKDGEDTRDYRFEPLDHLRAAGHSVDRSNYDLIYSASLSPLDTLEDIYRRFNTDHPADFAGHSLSVSDIVVLRQGKQETAHYCDSFGFTEVPEFLQQEQTAQLWNGIDGLINDKPFMPDASYNEQANALIDYAERDGQRLGNAERDLIIRYHEALQDLPKTVALVNELCKQGYEQQHGSLNYLVKQRIDAEITAAQQRQQDQPLPPSLDPAVQPVVTIIWSESDKLQEGDNMPLARADALFKSLDESKQAERTQPGYDGSWYDKTKFRIDFTFQGQRDNYEGRQDFGDGDGSLIEHIQAYHEHYAQDESYKNYVLHNDGQEAWEKDKSERDMLLTEFIPYMKLHCNLYEMEQNAAQPLEAGAALTPEQTEYFAAVLSYVDACRETLNRGEYALPAPPELADFSRDAAETEAYTAHVQEEIAEEAAGAGMTVEEYAANNYEPEEQSQTAPETPLPEEQSAAVSVKYYPINESTAQRAQEANSFRDYVPGTATAEYRSAVDKAAELAEQQKKRVDPMYHDKIDSLLDTYSRKLAENMNSRYAIDARVPSILISGGGNFPTHKKEKQNAARDRNMEDWQSIQGLLDKIRSTGMGGISADDPQALQKLQNKLNRLVQSQETMKAVNAYFRKHGTLDRCTHLTPEQISSLKADMAQSWHLDKSRPYQSYTLSNNNAEIRRTRERIENLKQHEQRSYAGWEFDGGRVEANKQNNRLQVFFDDKPDDKTREELKTGGFRWAPSIGAWQRQLNANAYRAAEQISSIQPVTGENPVQLQRQTQQAAPTPDTLLTGDRVTTPRGSFHLTSMSIEQMQAAWYGYHHASEDGKYHIMGNGTLAYAVAAPQQESHIKTAEMSTEQNYNMIDGIMNNTPTVDELEQKVKQGQSISLTQLADAMKAEGEKIERSSKKPSIRAQLKAGREQTNQQKKSRAISAHKDLERD